MDKVKKYRKRLIGAAAVAVGCLALALLALNWNTIYLDMHLAKYPVRGVDVSSWQGEIAWQELEAQHIDFAFIKATEGSSFVDSRFEFNWRAARKTNIAVGAYHFFSFDSGGDAQADNFISAVTDSEGALPPVIDLELYGDYIGHAPEKADILPELDTLLRRLERQYGQKPILYTTMTAYKLYISGAYPDYPVWVRDILRKPALPDGRNWTFWQYSDKGKLRGYSGSETYIDLNVFNGSLATFEDLLHGVFKATGPQPGSASYKRRSQYP